MQINVPIDIADAIQSALNADSHDASARPLPRDFDQRMPFTLVEPIIGGGRSDVVIDRHPVRLYTYAATLAEAIAESSAVMAALINRVGGALGGQPCYRVQPSDLPYEAHDPEHPDVARACFTAQVYTRAITIDQ